MKPVPLPIRYPLVIDGGLSNQLESQGHDLNDPLWTAGLLADRPEAIQKAHLAYLQAGARCLITASYQATIQGFRFRGLDHEAAEKRLLRTVDLARAAIREFFSGEVTDSEPLVAASIGPYGAFLADGSEYTGDYGISAGELEEFHRPRLEVLDASPADFFAVETIPSFPEAAALSRLLENTRKSAWVSFSCRDGRHLHDGTPIEECLRLLAGHPRVFAVGVNCTAPRHISELVRRIRGADPTLRIVIYPNSGEIYHAETKTWSHSSDLAFLEQMVEEWLNLGADIIGGCCRLGPSAIRTIARAVRSRR